jgi:hypothetical protein
LVFDDGGVLISFHGDMHNITSRTMNNEER